jgi:hypothetical protein
LIDAPPFGLAAQRSAIIVPCHPRAVSRRPGRSRKAPPASIVRDGGKQALAYVYFDNEPGRRSSAKLLTRDEAFLIAVNVAKLPSVPRQILKDIPRPPNSASRDD